MKPTLRIYRIYIGEPQFCSKNLESLSSTPYTMIQGSVANGKQERRMRFTDMGSKERLKLLRPMFPAKARLKKTRVPLSSQVLLMAGDSNRLNDVFVVHRGAVFADSKGK